MLHAGERRIGGSCGYFRQGVVRVNGQDLPRFDEWTARSHESVFAGMPAGRSAVQLVGGYRRVTVTGWEHRVTWSAPNWGLPHPPGPFHFVRGDYERAIDPVRRLVPDRRGR